MADTASRRKLKAGLVLAAAVGFAASPAFVENFGGFNADQFPVPQQDPPVQPAGYAFAIWGLIYAWLILGAGYGLLRHAGDEAWDRHRWPLFASLFIGCFWLWVATQSPLWATVVIWAMLITALAALFRTTNDGGARWWLQAPVAIYAGWLTAASSVSIGLIGAGYGLLPLGQIGWALVAIAVALILSGAVLRRLDRAPEYGLTVIWALVAVTVANWGAVWLLVGVCIIGIIAVLVLTLRNI